VDILAELKVPDGRAYVLERSPYVAAIWEHPRNPQRAAHAAIWRLQCDLSRSEGEMFEE
jgi:hypothetical protein